MTGHSSMAIPSAWVRRWAPLVSKGGAVLDVACGGGRHARFFAGLGHPVDAVDRDPEAIAAMAGVEGVTALCADIEDGPWPYAGRHYAAVIVTNYLHRPLFPQLVAALAPGGVLIYETFTAGNETVGKPSRSDFLLRPAELLQVCKDLRVVAFEDGFLSEPARFVQRVVATGLDRPAQGVKLESAL
jgi:SAM-dependent methyltransferase